MIGRPIQFRDDTQCNDDALQPLLDAEEDSSEFQQALSHVQLCAHCRERLEQLAGDEGLWQESRSALQGDDFDRQLLSATTETSWHRLQQAHPTVAWSDSMVKQLLQPPSHPEMLGRIGRYEVERLIGRGGMGVVFKAFDTELNRPVAIKVLAPHLAGNGAARQRFAREAKAVAAIAHEHIVAIHNVESNEASPYIVMQYVAGQSLQQRLDIDGPLELVEILRIAMQTAAGLAAAHAQGIVHRDVKPANILLEESIERAVLTDFGLARVSDDASLTHTGYHLGTPQYMSPEQASGEAIDARSDLFSLGSVIYAMCTGRPPFRAETTLGVLRRISDHEPRAMREINPNIPQWLERLVQQLHCKLVEQRISSAEEVRSLLEQCLAHVQQPAHVTLPAELTKLERSEASIKQMSRSTWLSILFMAACLMLAIIPFLYQQPKTNTAPNIQSGSTSTSSPTATPLDDSDSQTQWNWGDTEMNEVRQAISNLESRSNSID